MAVSKNKRKNGKKPGNHRAMLLAAMRRVKIGKYDSIEQYRRDMEFIEKDRVKLRNANARLSMMLPLADESEMTTGFLRAFGALESWKESKGRIERKSFQMVISSLMLGLMILERIDCIEDAEAHRRDLQDACFKSWLLYRNALNGHGIVDADIAFIHDELRHAQNLMETANEIDRQAFIDVLIQNDSDYIDLHPELIERRHKLALGRHYEMVCEWEKQDAFKLGDFEKAYINGERVMINRKTGELA